MSIVNGGRFLRTLALTIIASGLAHAGTISLTEGSITVTDAVTSVGSLFQNNFTVTDGTQQLAVLDIAIPDGAVISGFEIPGGPNAYSTAFDSVLDLASFVENNAIFPDIPQSGFIFDSSVPLGLSTFGVTLFDGTTAQGTFNGATPEPTSLALCVLGTAALLFWRKRIPAFRPR